MNAIRSRLLMLGLTLSLCVALVATGFGHRMPSRFELQVSNSAILTAVLGGVCGQPGADGSSADAGKCPICTLVGAALTPEIAQVGASADFVVFVLPPPPTAKRTSHQWPESSRGLRDPPSA